MYCEYGRFTDFRFEALWLEHAETNKYRSVISTDLSTTLNRISAELETTDLYDNESLRGAVLHHVFPRALLNKVGLDELERRVPSAYLRSAFAAYVASSFVYAKGPRASHVDFYNHVTELLRHAP